MILSQHLDRAQQRLIRPPSRINGDSVTVEGKLKTQQAKKKKKPETMHCLPGQRWRQSSQKSRPARPVISASDDASWKKKLPKLLPTSQPSPCKHIMTPFPNCLQKMRKSSIILRFSPRYAWLHSSAVLFATVSFDNLSDTKILKIKKIIKKEA
jgi:transglutaminase/protease-like cytokinesis protein 3